MRREPTPAQKEAAKARREKFQVIVRQIAKLSDDERAALSRRTSIVTVEGRGLSVHNQCLLASQCPSATVVGGFRQWQTAGRTVRKGEHGHMIWIPTHKVAENSAETPSEDGAEGRTFFIVGTVFDISQTDALTAESEAA